MALPTPIKSKNARSSLGKTSSRHEGVGKLSPAIFCAVLATASTLIQTHVGACHTGSRVTVKGFIKCCISDGSIEPVSLTELSFRHEDQGASDLIDRPS